LYGLVGADILQQRVMMNGVRQDGNTAHTVSSAPIPLRAPSDSLEHGVSLGGVLFYLAHSPHRTSWGLTLAVK